MAVTDERAINVRLPAEMYERLRSLAFSQRRSQAEIIRTALQRYFKEPETVNGNPD